MAHKHFMIWLSSYMSMWGGVYYLFERGFFDYLYKIDISNLSFVILAIFTVFYTRLGYYLFKYGLPDKKVSDNDLEPGYEAADHAMALGMLGTVIGFIFMSTSFTGIDFSNMENIKQLFTLAIGGMSTSLYTTAVGLVASILLRFTHYLTGRIL